MAAREHARAAPGDRVRRRRRDRADEGPVRARRRRGCGLRAAGVPPAARRRRARGLRQPRGTAVEGRAAIPRSGPGSSARRPERPRVPLPGGCLRGGRRPGGRQPGGRRPGGLIGGRRCAHARRLRAGLAPVLFPLAQPAGCPAAPRGGRRAALGSGRAGGPRRPPARRRAVGALRPRLRGAGLPALRAARHHPRCGAVSGVRRPARAGDGARDGAVPGRPDRREPRHRPPDRRRLHLREPAPRRALRSARRHRAADAPGGAAGRQPPRRPAHPGQRAQGDGQRDDHLAGAARQLRARQPAGAAAGTSAAGHRGARAGHARHDDDPRAAHRAPGEPGLRELPPGASTRPASPWSRSIRSAASARATAPPAASRSSASSRCPCPTSTVCPSIRAA